MNLITGFLAGYFIGGIPTGIWLCRLLKRVDPRTLGSGSSGATNISRVLGKRWAAIVLVIDALKGYLPVALLPGLPDSGSSNAIMIGVVISAGAILGHVYTPYASFRGGKGVATAAGSIGALSPLTLGVAFAGWLIVFALRRTVSLASLAAVIVLPFAAFLLPGVDQIIAAYTVLLSLFIVFTHRQNLARLLARTEKPVL